LSSTPDYAKYGLRGRELFNSFFGHELYALKKTAFPAAVESMLAQPAEKNYFTNWDHFYMTTYYYDYLTNVKLDQQLVTSHIIAPILDFFPTAQVIFAADKYDVVARINAANLDELRTHIFIERNTAAHAPALDVAQFFEPKNYVTYSPEEIANFDRQVALRYPANQDVSLTVAGYDVNHLSLNVDTPSEGYVYFGDGYSKHWQAFVDGKPAKIEKTNINFKAVQTPSGKHRVEFRYDPVLFRYSLYLYGIGNLLCGIVLITFRLTRWERIA
jgi:hypothetical protein